MNLSAGPIRNYVFCETCKCSVRWWDSYRWHHDQRHIIRWGSQSRAARAARGDDV